MAKRIPIDAATRRESRHGFGVAPVLYLLGLIGVGAGILFSSYSQTIRTNMQMTNSLAVQSDLNAAATTLAATSVLSSDDTKLCPPQGGYDTTNSTSCSSAPTKATEIYPTMAVSTSDAHLPTNYASASTGGSPVEVGIFTNGAGVKQLDPWGHYYIYCRWENGAASSSPAIQIISAGSTGVLNTVCGAATASTSPDNYQITMNAATAVNRAAVWQTGTSGGTSDVYYGSTGHQLTVDANGNLTVPGTIVGDSSIAATGQVSGASANFAGLVQGGSALFSGAIVGSSTISASGALYADSNAFSTGSGGTLAAANGLFSIDATGGITVGTGNFTVDGATGNTAIAGTLALGSTVTTVGLASIGTTTAASGSAAPLLTVGKKVGLVYPFYVDQYGDVTGATFTGSFSGNLAGSVTGGTVSATNVSTPTLTPTGGTVSVPGNLTATGTITAANFSGGISVGSGGSNPVTGVLPIANGGTGASTASGALGDLGVTSGGYLNTALLTTGLIPGADLTANSVTSSQLNSVVSPGTYDTVVVGADGRVTSGTYVPLNANQINDGSGDTVTAGTTGIIIAVGSATEGYWNTTGLMIGSSTVPKNRLDVYGATAIGTGYAGVDTAPTDGLIVAGSTGIGTSSPTTALQVVGTVTATAFSGSGAGLTSIGTSAISGTLGTGNGGTGTSTTFTQGSVVFAGVGGNYAQNNADFFWDNTNNRLGINTATPAGSIDVVGDIVVTGNSATGITNWVRGVAGGDANLVMQSNAGGGVAFWITAPNSSSELQIGGSGGTEPSVGAMNILSSGSVGIATTNPNSLLQIYGGEVQVGSSGAMCSLAVAGAIRYAGGALYVCDGSNWDSLGGSSGGTLPSLASGDVWVGNSSNVATPTPTTGTGNVVLSASPTLTGTVGIGTTSPNALLDIGSAATTLGTMRLEGSTSGYVQIQPSAAAGSWTLTLPGGAPSSSGYVLSSTTTGVTSWVPLSIGTGSITGTVQVSQGGTGDTTLTAHSVMLGEGAAAVGTAGPGATYTVLVGNGATSDPSFSGAPIISGALETLQSIGTTSTDGIYLANSTAATASTSQFSPRVHFTGQGWKTNSTAGSQTVDMIEELQPQQGTANPTGNLTWSSQVNSGGYSPLMTLTSGGNVGIGTTLPTGQLNIQQSTYGSNQVVISDGVTGTPPAYPSSITPALTVQTGEATGSRPLFFGYNNSGSWDSFMTVGACGSFGQLCLDFNNGSSLVTALSGVGNALYVGGGTDGNYPYIYLQATSLVALTGSAQLTVPNGSQGNPVYTFNSNRATGIYMPADNASMQFVANGSNVLNINTSGNVGIGTSSPNGTALLDVYSTTQGLLPPRMTTTQRNAITSPATGLTIYNTTNTELETYDGVTNGWEAVGAYAADAAGSNGQVQFNNAGDLGANANFFWDNTNYRLGIGTSVPLFPLVVSSTATNQAKFQSTGANNSTVAIDNVAGGNQTSILFEDAGTAKFQIGKQTDNTFFMYDSANTANFATVSTAGLLSLGEYGQISLPAAGNVGIGTASPGSLLTIEATNSIGLKLQTASTNQYEGIDFAESNGAERLVIQKDNNNALGIYTATGVAGSEVYAERMVMNASGSVGIGTTNPSTALQVVGTATATTFSGSGSGLTGIGTSNLTAVTGTPSSSTFLRGDNSWAALTIGTGSITGTVQVSQGGTGDTTLTAHGVVVGEGTANANITAAGASNTVLIGNGATADPSFSASPTLSGTITDVQSIGTTSTDGLLLTDTAAATASTSQFSPRVHFTGQGWKTNSTAGSQTVDMIEELQPVQGTANPTGNLTWSSQVNSGGYSPLMTLTSGGNVGIGTTSPGTYKLNVVGDIFINTGNLWAATGSVYSPTIYGGNAAAQSLTIDSSSASSKGSVIIAPSGGSVGIGTTAPNSTALLDVYSTTQGLLPPRMTTTQRNAITSPATGLTIYNTTNTELETYDGATNGWEAVGAYAADAAGSNGQVQFNNGGDLGANANFFWDNTNYRLGIGTSVPSYPLDVNGVVRAVGSSLTTGVDSSPSAQVINSNSTTPRYPNIVVRNYIGTAPNPYGYGLLGMENHNGSNGSGTAMISGNKLGAVSWSGDNGAGGTSIGAQILGVVTENWSNTANGTAINFYTTPNTTTSEIERMTIDQSGNVGIGTTSPNALLDIGSVATTLGTMRLEGSTSGYVQIQPSAAAGSWTITLPSGPPSTAGYVLSSTTSGVTSWVAASSAFSGLTSGDFCTAASSTAIQCSTASTGTGNVVLATSPSIAAPTLTGTVTLSGLTTAGVVETTAAGVISSAATLSPTYGGLGANESAATGVVQFSSGTASVSTALASGTTATTQSETDTSTKLATDAFVSGIATLSSLTSVGTITTGTWHGTAITVPYGGTGLATLSANVIYKGNGTSALAASSLTDNGTTVSTTESYADTQSIGTTSTDGMLLTDTTAATSSLNQWSPRVHFDGQGWKTNSTAGSQAVDMIEELQTATGTANPSGNLTWSSSVNASTYSPLMTLTSGGYLGIGTSLPGQALDVNGNVQIEGSDYIKLNAGQAINGFINFYGNNQQLIIANNAVSNGANYDVAANPATELVLGYGTISLNVAPAAGSGAISWTNGLTISSTGSVGIGTSSPNSTALLDVYSTTQGLLPPRMTTTQRNAITSPATGLTIYNTTNTELETYDGATNGWEAVGAYAADAAGSNGQVQFNNGGDLGANANLFWDNTNYRLGIGTSSPSAPLHVYSATNHAPSLTYGSAAGAIINNGLQDLAMGTDSSAPYTFWLQARLFTNAANSMALNPLGGNVGIGTEVPANKLDVNGSLAVGTYAGTATGGSNELIVSGNVGVGVTSPSYKLDVETTDTATANAIYAPTYSALTVLPSANQTAGRTDAAVYPTVSIPAANTYAVQTAAGQAATAYNSGTGSVNVLSGSNNFADNTGNATVNTITGTLGGGENDAGTVTNLYGGDYITSVTGGTVSMNSALSVYTSQTGGTVTTNTGLAILNIQSGGTLTNRYGIFMYAPTGTATNDYGIYEQGAQNNYFAGAVGVGATTPSAKLTSVATTSYGTDTTYAIHAVDGSNVAKRLALGYDDTINAGVIASVYTGNSWQNTVINPSGGSVGIGTTNPSTALQVVGTATATTFSGSGSGLTGIGTSNLTAVTGTPSSSTFLRGDNSWATPSIGTGSITGTVQVSQGGTGDTTLTAHGVVVGEGTANANITAAGASNTVLIGNGATADPSFSASPTLSGTITDVQSIGTTSTDGLLLTDTTAATSSLNQWSPRVHFDGRGWKTNSTAGSQAVDMIEELQTVTGTANPTGNLTWSSSVNASTYSPLMTLTSGGYLGIGTTSPNALLDVGSVATTLGTMRLEGSTSGYVQIQPSAAAGSWTITLPPGPPSTAGYVLSSTTSGVTSWVSSGAGTLPSLTNGDIWVGNSSNVATAVALSGDVTITNAGAATVGSIGGKAVSLAGSFTTSGAYGLTLTTTGTTNVTLPTSGTLVNTAVTTLSSLSSVGTITTGVWNATPISTTYGGLGGNFGSSSGALSISAGTVTAGTLSVGNGGTGLATLSANVIYKGNGTSALAASSLTDNGTTVNTTESFADTQSIGTTSTDGMLLADTTAATSSLNQWSPRVHFDGRGWKTNSTAASQAVDMIEELQTATGTANPTGNLVFSSSVNASTYSPLMTLTSGGYLGIGTTSPSVILDVVAPSGLVGGTNYVVFNDGNQDRVQFRVDSGGGQTIYLNSYFSTIQSGNALNLNPNGGDVGIGTSNPQEALDVYGFIAADGNTAPITSTPPTMGSSFGWKLGFYNGGDAWGVEPYALMHGLGSSTYWYSIVPTVGANNATTTTPDTNAVFSVHGNGDVFASDKIGIGTTTANALLDVGSAAGTLGTMRLEGSTSGYVQIQPTAAAGSWTITLPSGPPSTAGYVLSSTTSGVTSWVSSGAGTLPSLTNGDIWVGNSSNVATAVALSGDVTITNAGAATVGSIGGKAVSLAGSFTTSGAYGLTLTTTGTTNVTLPTSGTLVNTAVTTLSSLSSVGTITTGVWNGTIITVPYGGTGLATLSANVIYKGNGTSAMAASSLTDNGTIVSTTESYADTQSIGTTSTDGMLLADTTAATSTLNQWSPRVHFDGRGWKTNSTAGSQAVDMIEELQTVTGTANPTGNLTWSGQVNSGGYGALMTLTSGGALGIGTTSPATNLDVVSTSSPTFPTPWGIVSDQFSTTDYGASFFGRKARGTTTSPTTVVNGDFGAFMGSEFYDGSSYNLSGYEGFIVDGTVNTGSVPTDFAVFTGSTNLNAAERMRVTSGGLVGIGTSSPNALLDIGSTGTLGTMRLEGSTSGYVQIQPSAAAGSWTMTLPSGPPSTAGYVLSSTTSGVTSWVSSTPTFSGLTSGDFCTAASSTAIQCSTASTGSGNVVLSASPTLTGTIVAASESMSGVLTDTQSIGTTSTDGLLLTDTTAATSTLNQWSPRVHFDGRGWKSNSTAGSQAVDMIEELQTATGTANPTGNLVFSSSVNASTYSPLMTLTSGGNVGIGTTSPANTLDVYGAGVIGAAYTGHVGPSNGLAIQGNLAVGNIAGNALLSIGTNFSSSASSTIFTTNAGALSSTSGTDLLLGSIGFTAANEVHLGVHGIRTAAGSDWTTTAVGVSMDVDATQHVNGSGLWLGHNGGVGIGTTLPANALDINGSLAVGSYAGTATGGSNELVVSGSVGIGTSSPAEALDIEGSNVYYGIRVANSSGNDMRLFDDGLAHIEGSSGSFLNINGDSNAVTSIGGGGGNTWINPSGGSVGIGTAGPGATLDVNGNIRTTTVMETTVGSAIASASTIAPVTGLFHVTGTAAISTITPPTGMSTTIGGCIIMIADGAWTTTTSGNIHAAMTATAGVLYNACYDGSKWYIK